MRGTLQTTAHIARKPTGVIDDRITRHRGKVEIE
jgi:hypothetical protein